MQLAALPDHVIFGVAGYLERAEKFRLYEAIEWHAEASKTLSELHYLFFLKGI